MLVINAFSSHFKHISKRIKLIMKSHIKMYISGSKNLSKVQLIAFNITLIYNTFSVGINIPLSF